MEDQPVWSYRGHRYGIRTRASKREGGEGDREG